MPRVDASPRKTALVHHHPANRYFSRTLFSFCLFIRLVGFGRECSVRVARQYGVLVSAPIGGKKCVACCCLQYAGVHVHMAIFKLYFYLRNSRSDGQKIQKNYGSKIYEFLMCKKSSQSYKTCFAGLI